MWLSTLCAYYASFDVQDMMELGKLHNVGKDYLVNEDRSHFSAWAITSSPLILGVNLSWAVMNDIWPVISNREVIKVNQAWAGSAGKRLHYSQDYQVWAKPTDKNGSHAVMFLSNSTEPIDIELELKEISVQVANAAANKLLSVRDLWARKLLPASAVLSGTTLRVKAVPSHDSRMLLLGATGAVPAGLSVTAVSPNRIPLGGGELTVTGTGFGAAGGTGWCRLESTGAVGPLSHSIPSWGYKGPSISVIPASVKSDTELVCLSPAMIVPGRAALTVTIGSATGPSSPAPCVWSKACPDDVAGVIEYFSLVDAVIGRRPYIAEAQVRYASFAPFIYKNDHFTKTGSGQT